MQPEGIMYFSLSTYLVMCNDFYFIYEFYMKRLDIALIDRNLMEMSIMECMISSINSSDP